MSMSKKDFIGLADVLKRWTARDVSKDVILDIADFLESSNPMFKRGRWLDYVQGKCGPNGGSVGEKPKRTQADNYRGGR